MGKIEGPNFEGDANYTIPKAIPKALERILRSAEEPLGDRASFSNVIAQANSRDPNRTRDFNSWLKHLDSIEPTAEELAIAEQCVDNAINLALGRRNPN